MKTSKAKKVKTINEKTLIVAVDAGKFTHHGYFRAPNGEEVESFPFYNFRKGYRQFWKQICKFKKAQGLEDVVFGFESTGCYAEPLLHFMRKKPIKVVQINPVHSKRLKELTGNSPNKTDKKDPRVIADVIELGHGLTTVVPEGAAAELRRLSHMRERAIGDRTAFLNRVQDLMFIIFPEFWSIIKDMSTKTAHYLIKNHPTPESIVAVGEENLCSVLWKVSRGRIQVERSLRLYEAAKSSVGVKEGKASIVLEIAHLIRKVENENSFIEQVKEQMKHYLKEIPYSASILSIRGIGTVTVAGLIGEVGDFREFKTIGEILKLAGLNLYEISSGKHRGQRRISKRGRSLMRKLLYFAAMNMVKKNGILHAEYQRMLGRGMLKKKALVAIDRKSVV